MKTWRTWLLIGTVAVCLHATAGAAQTETEPVPDEPALARAAMMDGVVRHAEVMAAAFGVPVPSAAVIEVMSRVPRHEFVPEALVPLAYLDSPLPIGDGQNIAQPYIVALMTELAAVAAGDRVYETGTGAGYHAAVLSDLGAQVFSVEIVETHATRAAEVLGRLGYRNVEIRVADGYDGWPEEAPFDAIIVKESVSEVPAALFRQLRPGGRLVAPIGPPDGPQILSVVRKDADGKPAVEKILPVRFSPFQGGQRT